MVKNNTKTIGHATTCDTIIIIIIFSFYNIKIYKHEIQEKLNKKHIKIQGLNIHYKRFVCSE